LKQVPILDLSQETEILGAAILDALRGVIESGQFIMGPNVRAFEDEMAAYLGVKHAVALNSGTDALVIALRAAGIGSGDEVVTTPFTFFATAEAISHLGAVPVFADIDPATFNIDPAGVERAITARTKAILPVHLFGQGAEMDRLMSIARQYRLQVIEDVAQGMGGEYLGKKLGTFGDAGCFSFFPTKNLGAYGDGGMMVTDSDEIAAEARMLRSHGSKKKYFNETVGYNSRLDEVQAAILRVKLPYLDGWNEGRYQAAMRYQELLANVEGIVTPYLDPKAKHVFHQYTVRVHGGRRDEVQRRLAEQGISTMIYYPVPLHRLPMYHDLHASFRLAEIAANEVLSLPIWPRISQGVQERVAQALRAFQ
jgi:dTDP-4-amino-4,6-dideoxygalactose transaminase